MNKLNSYEGPTGWTNPDFKHNNHDGGLCLDIFSHESCFDFHAVPGPGGFTLSPSIVHGQDPNGGDEGGGGAPGVANVLPDEALVVRGGTNTADRFLAGAESVDESGTVHGVSVNSFAELSVAELAVGIKNGQIGVTTVGAVRAAGGEVVANPLPNNPYHALLSGLTPEQAESLFTPTIGNPSR